MTVAAPTAPAAFPSLLHTRILAILPHRHRDLARIDALSPASPVPVITVVGKYNQGKSRLLNELCGDDVFAVADRRETTQVSHYDRAGARWMDAPGLDADVAQADDQQAEIATWISADIRLLVHSAKGGELDGTEVSLAKALVADDALTGRKSLLVLTQIDQVPDAAVLAGITASILEQVPDLPLHAVSAVRHHKGREGGKALMISSSGIPALAALLEEIGSQVPSARAGEIEGRLCNVLNDLNEEIAVRQQALISHQTQMEQAREDFLQGLYAMFAQAAEDVDALDAGEALIAQRPDTHAERYIMTEAKHARTRQQLVYSRINLRLSAYLTGHAVQMQLPDPGAMPAGLNTVMVAVLGVAVKYRDELRRMFCEQAGSQRLQDAFTRYFDASAARQHGLAQTQVLSERLSQARLACEALLDAYPVTVKA